MADALMAMFWAGLGTGLVIGIGITVLIGAVWWFWPQRDDLLGEEIGPDDEFRVVADDYVPVEWGE